ncbi:MAG: S41 family peptidase [Acidobacteriota bacterium]
MPEQTRAGVRAARLGLRIRVSVAALLVVVAVAGRGRAQDPVSDAVLRFETTPEDGRPGGWFGGPPEHLGVDEQIVHGGDRSATITRSFEEDSEFSTLTLRVPAGRVGQRIVFKAWVRSREVVNFFGLWLRQDGRAGTVDFQHNYELDLKGDQEWREVAVSTVLSDRAESVFFGVILNGPGKVWIDDVELLLDGKPWREAEVRELERLPMDDDTRFTGGSNLGPKALSETQVERVAELIEVWGFVKAHHPKVLRGEVHWDFELLRALGELWRKPMAAVEHRRWMASWLEELGLPERCDSCKPPDGDVHLPTRHDWIFNEERLGSELTAALVKIHAGRLPEGGSVYVRLNPGVGNPDFGGEQAYAHLDFVDAGFRLLALARLWDVVERWFPYRDLIDTPWPEVLRAAIPRFAAELDGSGYKLELLRVIAEIRDTHANLWSGVSERPPTGDCSVDAGVRFLRDEATVWALPSSEAGKPVAAGLEIGDVVTHLDGRSVAELVAEWSPVYAASNVPTRLRDIGRSLGLGECDAGTVWTVERRTERGSKEAIDVELVRSRRKTTGLPGGFTHDRAGETIQDLGADVLYVKLSSVKQGDGQRIVEAAAGKKALVVDLRNYPSAFMVFELGGRLVKKNSPFARFTSADLGNPGAFRYGPSLFLSPLQPSFDGPVAVLVDEVSQSSAEYTAMALSADDDAVVVGSMTAGADGNVSPLALPGGQRTMISGIGVFYPDKTPTQRIGIVPDIEVIPTPEGLRDGRDEVLEAALRHLLGDGAEEVAIREVAAWPLAKPPTGTP